MTNLENQQGDQGNQDQTVNDLHGDPQTREQLVNRLRSNLGWVSAKDHSVAIDLDDIIHGLETLALNTVRLELEKVTADRDSLRADMWRIYKIVKNPMVEYGDEISALQISAMNAPSHGVTDKLMVFDTIEKVKEAFTSVIVKGIDSRVTAIDPIIKGSDGQPNGSVDV